MMDIQSQQQNSIRFKRRKSKGRGRYGWIPPSQMQSKTFASPCGATSRSITTMSHQNYAHT